MPSSVRIYLGRMPYRATERDIEDFFRGYGKISDIMIKTGFAFVEFSDARDADDAAHDLNGRMMMGERTVSVEVARGTPRGRDSFGGSSFGGGGGGRERDSGRRSDRRPERSDYRLIVSNLSTRIGWQELKDVFRDIGDVCYADAHTRKRNEGLVEFSREKDMIKALEKMDGKEFNGRKIELKEDVYTKKRRRSRSGSGSRSRSRSGGRRRSRSDSGSRSRSPTRKRNKKSKSRSSSRSASPADKKPTNGGKTEEGEKEERKESATPPPHNGEEKTEEAREKSKSRSASPASD